MVKDTEGDCLRSHEEPWGNTPERGLYNGKGNLSTVQNVLHSCNILSCDLFFTSSYHLPNCWLKDYDETKNTQKSYHFFSLLTKLIQSRRTFRVISGPMTSTKCFLLLLIKSWCYRVPCLKKKRAPVLSPSKAGETSLAAFKSLCLLCAAHCSKHPLGLGCLKNSSLLRALLDAMLPLSLHLKTLIFYVSSAASSMNCWSIPSRYPWQTLMKGSGIWGLVVDKPVSPPPHLNQACNPAPTT